MTKFYHTEIPHKFVFGHLAIAFVICSTFNACIRTRYDLKKIESLFFVLVPTLQSESQLPF